MFCDFTTCGIADFDLNPEGFGLISLAATPDPSVASRNKKPSFGPKVG